MKPHQETALDQLLPHQTLEKTFFLGRLQNDSFTDDVHDEDIAHSEPTQQANPFIVIFRLRSIF